MSPLRLIAYFFREARLDLGRHKALYGFAWFVVTLSIFVLAVSRYVTGNVNDLIGSWEKDLDVRVFLRDDLPREEIDGLIKSFEKDSCVREVFYVSPEDGLKILEKVAPAFKTVESSAEGSPLPPSLSLRLKAPVDLDRVRRLVAESSKVNGVAQVIFDWDWVEHLRTYSRFASLIGWTLFVALGIAAAFTVAAICRIIALHRREEIAVLHFLGATGTSIRGPFVAGGVMIGFAASVAALLLAAALHLALGRVAASGAVFWGWMSRSFLSPGDQLLLVVAGVFLGAIGGFAGLGSLHKPE